MPATSAPARACAAAGDEDPPQHPPLLRPQEPSRAGLETGRTCITNSDASHGLARATQEWMHEANWDEARRLAQVHQNNLKHHKAGHAFEFLEAIKFNANAARAGEAVRAVTTASV